MDENPQLEGPAAEGTITTEVEEKQVEERVAIGAHVVYETIRREGEEELARPAAALAWSGLAAGLSMGFSFVAEALIQNRLPERPWARLVSSLGYSVGFLIVVLGRQQLFTENTLTVILPFLLGKKLNRTGESAAAVGDRARSQSGGDVPVCILHRAHRHFRPFGSADADGDWRCPFGK